MNLNQSPAEETANAPMIVCENLVKIFKTLDSEVIALQGLDLTIEKGELMAIIGNSGSGKSTLLNMLGGLDRPSAGKLEVNGHDLLKISDKAMIRYKRDTVGFVWQNNARNLIPYLSALENVEMPMRLQGRVNRKRASELLDLVGLSHRRQSTLAQLSGGEQQRVAVAIALSNNPPLLLADEPTGALDTRTSGMLLDMLRDLNKQLGLTIVIVTHDRQVSKQVDRVVSISDGKTTTEFLKRASLQSIGSLSEQNSDTTHDEVTVLDRAGRIQLPAAMIEQIGLKGNKVQLSVEDGRIILAPYLAE